jgi:response regulator RpfG family c-di-GMP phosphodiesterase
MSPPALLTFHDGDTEDQPEDQIPNVVVVDPRFDCYKPLAASARMGKLNVHFRSSGTEALKLACRFRVDAWLVAPELDDISGQDFIQLLQARVGASRLAMVETAEPGSATWESAAREAAEAGAAATLSPPITFRDLEHLLGVPAEQRGAIVAGTRPAARAFATLPIGVSVAAVAIAVLMLG